MRREGKKMAVTPFGQATICAATLLGRIAVAGLKSARQAPR